ncbi:DNA polymerase III subunit beta [Candidatus Methylomirabilis sp.]|uniref:DNA polymerase III subunit beta n=1 Tax=Candidatus Methylomirabilis sp. TaxID=2032687 RepID=UPI002A5C511A|nr:DNA polymerase III subunit beta [Candidatus Methylomirabilis sp.]
MHIKVLRDDLLNGVGPIQAVVETKRSLPILSHLLLESTSSYLSVFGTDLDVGVRKRVPGQVLREGSVALSARKLYEIVRELPATSVDLVVDTELTATITCGNSEFRIKGLSRDDFPSMREPKQKGIVLDRRLFRDMIRRTLFAVSSDQTRYTLNGILFRVTPKDVKMVATDGHRLAMTNLDDDVLKDGNPMDAIIPRKAAAETLKLLREEPGEIEIEISDNHLLLQTDDTLIDARLIEGQFPNYEQVIPANATKEVTVNREAFLAGLRRTSTILGERALPTTMKLTPGRLLLSCVNLDLGEAREHLDVEYQHEEMSVGFNARYILDFLGVLTTEQATIRLQDPLSPALFAGKDDKRYTCVIMPMRI